MTGMTGTEEQTGTAGAASVPDCPEYDNLTFFFNHTQGLFHIKTILGFDMMTVMPPAAARQRTGHIAALTKRIYAETVSGPVGKALDAAQAHQDARPDAWPEADRRNLAEMRRIYDHMSSVPPELFLAVTRAANEGRQIYDAALRKNDRAGLSAWLDKVVALTKSVNAHKTERFGPDTHYRRLLRNYLRDSEDFDTLVRVPESIAQSAAPVLRKALAREGDASRPSPHGDAPKTYTRQEQVQVYKTLLEAMGYE